MAGRPINSKTPLWRKVLALKVRVYRWMERDRGTKYNCAKTMGISRTTFINGGTKWNGSKKLYEDGSWFHDHGYKI